MTKKNSELEALEKELYAEGETVEPSAEDGATTAVISKNQLKKQAKIQKYQELKKKRKETEKEERQHKKQRVAKEKSEMMSSMTEEEVAKYREEHRAKLNAIKKAEVDAKEKLREAQKSGQRIVIDLDFDGLMTENDKRHLCQQLAFSYAANKTSGNPCHLILSSFAGGIEQTAKKVVAGMENWICTRTPQAYHEHLKEEKDKIVYLTADSSNEIEELEQDKIYVIGGIVDHNRHKNLCFNRAKEAGVATARLPISKHVQLGTSAVLTVNHVMSLLVGYLESRDWPSVLDKVLPQRKRAEYFAEHTSKKARRQANWEKPGDEAPETKDVEVKVPETKDVEVKAPETKDVEVKAPETKDVEGKAPKTKDVEGKAPKTKDVEGKAPKTKDVEGEAPEASGQKPSRRSTRKESKKSDTGPAADEPPSVKKATVKRKRTAASS